MRPAARCTPRRPTARAARHTRPIRPPTVWPARCRKLLGFFTAFGATLLCVSNMDVMFTWARKKSIAMEESRRIRDVASAQIAQK